MQHIFGPVLSRRFGKSLGVDLSSSVKQCNFDCLYCELKPQKAVEYFTVITPVEEILEELQEALIKHKDIDVITVTANGEPTLYPHLKELIIGIKKIATDTKILILSNASTIADPFVQDVLMLFDEVKLSLDSVIPKTFKKLDRPHAHISLDAIINGMVSFSNHFLGHTIIEVLVVKHINDTIDEMKAINDALSEAKIYRIDLSTIDRPPAYKVEAISYETLLELSYAFDAKYFVALAARKPIAPIANRFDDDEIIATIAKRPLTKSDIEILFDEDSIHRLNDLVKNELITIQLQNGLLFYHI